MTSEPSSKEVRTTQPLTDHGDSANLNNNNVTSAADHPSTLACLPMSAEV